MRRFVALACLCVLVLGVAACRPGSTGGSGGGSAGPPVLVAYRFPATTQSYTLHLEVGGGLQLPPGLATLSPVKGTDASGRLPIALDLDLGLDRTAVVDGSRSVITLRATGLSGTASAAGKAASLDAGGLGAGASTVLTVSADGTVGTVSGEQELAQAVGAALGGGSIGRGIPGVDPAAVNVCPTLPPGGARSGQTWVGGNNIDLGPKMQSSVVRGTYPKPRNRVVDTGTIDGTEVVTIQSVMRGPVQLRMEGRVIGDATRAVAGDAAAAMPEGIFDSLEVAVSGRIDLTSHCSIAKSDGSLVAAGTSGRVKMTFRLDGRGMIAQFLNGLAFDLTIDADLQRT